MSAAELQDARLRRLLDERSAMLAQRGADATAAATDAYLVCTCGTERLGLPLGDVASVQPTRSCTPVPGAPPALRGIMAGAGGIVSVIDLATALGLARGGDWPAEGHTLRMRTAAAPIALAVDRVLGIAHVATASITRVAVDADTPSNALGGDLIVGYAPPESGRASPEGFAILDTRRLLRRYLP